MMFRRFILAATSFMVVALILIDCSTAKAAEFSVQSGFAERVKKLYFVFPEALSLLAPRISGISSEAGRRVRYLPEMSAQEQGGTLDYNVLRISGLIEKGDSLKLQQFFESTTFWQNRWIISLNSEGGDFEEGLVLASLIYESMNNQDPQVEGLIVFAEDTCTSACAIVFTLGGSQSQRALELGAKLQYHLPSLPEDTINRVPKRLEDIQSLIKDSMRVSFDVVKRMNGLFTRNENDPYILDKMLEHSEDSFFDVIGDVDAWALGFDVLSEEDLALPIHAELIDVHTALRICDIYMYGRSLEVFQSGLDLITHQPFSPLIVDVRPLNEVIAELSDDNFITHVTDGYCQLGIDDDGLLTVSAWISDLAGCIDELSVRSTTLPFCRSQKVSGVRVSTYMLAVALGCTQAGIPRGLFAPEIWNADTPGPTAKSNLNIRAAPSTSAEVLGRLGQTESFSVIDCTISNTGEPVWFRITSAGQPSGWVSARFVSGQFALHYYMPLLWRTQ